MSGKTMIGTEKDGLRSSRKNSMRASSHRMRNPDGGRPRVAPPAVAAAAIPTFNCVLMRRAPV